MTKGVSNTELSRKSPGSTVAADGARSHGHGVRILGPHRIVSRDVKYKISELVIAGSVPDKQLAEWNPQPKLAAK